MVAAARRALLPKVAECLNHERELAFTPRD
jgi:hypothetical protein